MLRVIARVSMQSKCALPKVACSLLNTSKWLHTLRFQKFLLAVDEVMPLPTGVSWIQTKIA